MKTYNLFISHSWTYGEQYQGLISLLENARYFSFKNYSVPEDDPIHNAGTDAQLREAIRNQMSSCHAILILAGVYSTYSRWINEEIDLAESGFYSRKPIIAIAPWAAARLSAPVQEAADRVVKWNTNSIVSAIREVAI